MQEGPGALVGGPGRQAVVETTQSRVGSLSPLVIRAAAEEGLARRQADVSGHILVHGVRPGSRRQSGWRSREGAGWSRERRVDGA